MARLPQPGGDQGRWGNILNDYLVQAHNPDGTLKDSIVGPNQLQAGAFDGETQALITDPNSATTAALVATYARKDSGILIATNGKKYQIVACVIRNNGTGFELINDAGHTPIGVSSVTAEGDMIVINYNFTAKTVGSLTVSPDETFALSGYTVGASVGLSVAKINVGSSAIWSDYIYWNTTTSAWVSFNNLAVSIAPHTSPSAAAQGWFYYQHAVRVNMTSPHYGGSLSCRTSTYAAYLESPGPGTTGGFGGFSFRFVDAATRAVIPATDPPTADMKVWVMLNTPITRQVAISELVNASANFWVYGVFEIE